MMMMMMMMMMNDLTAPCALVWRAEFNSCIVLLGSGVALLSALVIRTCLVRLVSLCCTTRPSCTMDDDEAKLHKRVANAEAAKRYRQKQKMKNADEEERDKKGKSGKNFRANIKQAKAVEKATTAASAKTIEKAAPMEKQIDAPSSAASPSASPHGKSDAGGIFPRGYSRNSAASIASDMTKESADIQNTDAHLDVKEFVQGCAGIRANQNLQTCIC
jgi:hypothetical protein